MDNNIPGVETNDPTAPEGQEGVKSQSAPTDAGQSEIDYRAELEKVKQEKENYKQGLLNAKQELKKLKKGGDDDEDEEIDQEAIIDARVKQAVEENLQILRKDVFEVTVNNFLDTLSANADEKELIRFHYENSIKQSGTSASDIKRDLENAKLMANRNKLLAENSALKDAIIAKNSITSAGVGASASREPLTQVKLSPADQALLTRVNARRVARGEKPLTAQEIVK